MKRQPLKFRLNVIGAAIVIFLCFRTYLPLIGQNLGLNKNFALWLTVCSLTLALSCLVPIAFLEKMCDFHPILFKKQNYGTDSFAIIGMGMLSFILMAVANSIILFPLEKLGIVFPRQTLQNTDSFPVLILYFLYIAVLPAVCEELLVRGVILNLLTPYGTRFAVIASSLIFTVMHTGVQSFIPVFGAAVVLACVYLHTDNIYMSMILHFLNNSYSFFVMYARQKLGGISATAFNVLLIAVIITAGAAGWLYLKRYNINIFESMEKQLNKGGKLSMFIQSPVMVLALICCFMAIGGQLYRDLVM